MENPVNPFLDFVSYNWIALVHGTLNEETKESNVAARVMGLIGLIPTVIALPFGGVYFLTKKVIVFCYLFEVRNVAYKIIKPSSIKLELESQPQNRHTITTNKIAELHKGNIATELSTTKASKSPEHTYILGTFLGGGTAKSAYVAKNIMTGNFIVNVKYLPGIVPKDRKREIEMMDKFQGNPDFVQKAYTVTVNEEVQAIGLEYCNRGSVETVFDELADEDKWNLFETLARGLIAMKKESIVHHDLKFDNIFVNQIDGKLKFKIGDLGLAKTYDEGRTEFPGGSIPTMAPECLDLGEKDRSKSDLWSAGILMYEMYYGISPLHVSRWKKEIGPASNYQKIIIMRTAITNYLNKDFRLKEIHDDKDSIPKIIADLLQIDPEKRPSPEDLYKRLLDLKESGVEFSLPMEF